MCLAATAFAEPKLTVIPDTAKPGDPVLVTVSGATTEPVRKGLRFWTVQNGYQGVFAVPLDAKQDVSLAIGGKTDTIVLGDAAFPETSVIVEDDYANPTPDERKRIDADNTAIFAAFGKADGPPQFSQPFNRPPGEITSPFGEWRHFNDGRRDQHLGVDTFATEGSQVAAVNAGTVVLVRDGFLTGNTVVIAHGGGIASAYFHLSRIDVREGDTVQRGRTIGLAGHTGRATGPHLHTSIHVPTGYVDPIAFFRLPITPPRAAP